MANPGDKRYVFFQQRKPNGSLEYRLRFGRQKVAVMQRGRDGFFYVNLYDNRPGQNTHMSLGFDEASELGNIVKEMENLQQSFYENLQTEEYPSIQIRQNDGNGGTETGMGTPRGPPPPYVAEPIRVLGDHNMERGKEVPLKKRKLETATQEENAVPQDLFDFLSQPFY